MLAELIIEYKGDNCSLTRSMMIGFYDVLPVYIFMGIAIGMMLYEAYIETK
jgi:hypothetical protein